MQPNTITIHIPINFRMNNRQKIIIVPDEVLPQRQPKIESRLLSVIAKGFAWRRRIEEGKVRHMQELAEKEKVSLTYVYDMINLTYLPPKIVEAIVLGKQSRSLDRQTMEKMTKKIIWEEQIEIFADNI